MTKRMKTPRILVSLRLAAVATALALISLGPASSGSLSTRPLDASVSSGMLQWYWSPWGGACFGPCGARRPNTCCIHPFQPE